MYAQCVYHPATPEFRWMKDDSHECPSQYCPGREKYPKRMSLCRFMYIHVYVCEQFNISTVMRAHFIPEAHSMCPQPHSCVVA